MKVLGTFALVGLFLAPLSAQAEEPRALAALDGDAATAGTPELHLVGRVIGIRRATITVEDTVFPRVMVRVRSGLMTLAYNCYGDAPNLAPCLAVPRGGQVRITSGLAVSHPLALTASDGTTATGEERLLSLAIFGAEPCPDCPDVAELVFHGTVEKTAAITSSLDTPGADQLFEGETALFVSLGTPYESLRVTCAGALRATCSSLTAGETVTVTASIAGYESGGYLPRMALVAKTIGN